MYNSGTKRTITWISIVAGIILVGIIGYIVFINLSANAPKDQQTTGPNYTELTNGVKSSERTDTNSYKDLLNKYSGQYEKTYAEVTQAGEPADWDEKTVEKVYFIIEYSMKVGSYRMIGMWLDKLDEAAKAGTNIDIPSIGADKAYRDSLRATFNDAMSNPDYLPTSAKRES